MLAFEKLPLKFVAIAEERLHAEEIVLGQTFDFRMVVALGAGDIQTEEDAADIACQAIGIFQPFEHEIVCFGCDPFARVGIDRRVGSDWFRGTEQVAEDSIPLTILLERIEKVGLETRRIRVSILEQDIELVRVVTGEGWSRYEGLD